MKTTEQEILDFATYQWGGKELAAIALKLAEECGEIAGAIIKTNEGRSTYAELDEEMGDALIVLSQLAARRGTTLEDLRSQRFAQIQERAKIKGCAACDRGDYQLGHAEHCFMNTPKKEECEGRCSGFGKCSGTVRSYDVKWCNGKRTSRSWYCEEGARLTCEMGYEISLSNS